MFCPPDKNCAHCPRLKDFREENRRKFPDRHNAPVPSFGSVESEILIVGLAPGLRGANFTGRPFTGDYAGDTLYGTLLKFGLASGHYGARPDDGLRLLNCRITNAVRCVPPENKPTRDEMQNCLPYLQQEIAAMPYLRVILSLGRISHDSVLRTLGLKLSAYPFAHGALHELPNGVLLADSYHCSRYNTNTGRLTDEMFEAVFKNFLAYLKNPEWMPQSIYRSL